MNALPTEALAQKSADATSKLQHPQPVSAPVFPIRVIDVEQTVASRHGNVLFTKPRSWDFHTISHTWSKGVQSWSNIIACKMAEQSTAGAAESSYNELFRREDFRKHECYAPFIEFLSLLYADGVKQVWLDALCINQESESVEKSQELQKMGSYYAKSMGCYVCAHGFGEGFETWKENQESESGEKSQELQKMGSYYAKSMGCYVCAHGFGEGFETWKEGPESELVSELVIPRWFNRVWTFQEMLLPKTLTFVLDIHPVIRRTINRCISQRAAQGVNGACKCAMGIHLLSEPHRLTFIEEAEELEDVEEESWEDVEVCSSDDELYQQRGNDDRQRGIEIRCGNLPCSRCGGAALIRRAKDTQLLRKQLPGSRMQAPDLYFVDRQCIVRLMLMAGEQLESITRKIHPKSAVWKLLRLEAVMQQRDAEVEEETNVVQGGSNVEDNEQQHGGWDPIQVVVEVSRRDCTHDEDRILSILGLLKLEGTVQLRAGKTLDAQLLQLAQQLTQVDPTALLKLCVAQFAGHTRPGMSWAPSLGVPGGLRPTGEGAVRVSWRELRRDEQRYARQMEVEEGIEPTLHQLGQLMRHFVRSMQVSSVMDDGSLMLCRARVLGECRFQRVQDQDLFNLHLINARTDHHLSFPFKAYFTPSSCLLHHRVFLAGPVTISNQSMVRLEGTHLQGRLHSFRVCLVLLGRLELPIEGAKHQVMMVCVGSKEHETGLAHAPLHKVGVAWLPGLEEAFSVVQPSPVCIGGFQDYLNRFVLESY